jgi:hypothetical protein
MLYSLTVENFYFGEMVFFLLTCWAAWMTGRAVASIWKPVTVYLAYSLLLAAAARFLHFALYDGPFLSLTHYLTDLVVLAAIGVVAYRYTRTNQMVTQYDWLYEKASPLSWKARG